MWARPPPQALFHWGFWLAQVTESCPISATVPETVPAARSLPPVLQGRLPRCPCSDTARDIILGLNARCRPREMPLSVEEAVSVDRSTRRKHLPSLHAGHHILRERRARIAERGRSLGHEDVAVLVHSHALSRHAMVRPAVGLPRRNEAHEHVPIDRSDADAVPPVNVPEPADDQTLHTSHRVRQELVPTRNA